MDPCENTKALYKSVSNTAKLAICYLEPYIQFDSGLPKEYYQKDTGLVDINASYKEESIKMTHKYGSIQYYKATELLYGKNKLFNEITPVYEILFDDTPCRPYFDIDKIEGEAILPICKYIIKVYRHVYELSELDLNESHVYLAIRKQSPEYHPKKIMREYRSSNDYYSIHIILNCDFVHENNSDNEMMTVFINRTIDAYYGVGGGIQFPTSIGIKPLGLRSRSPSPTRESSKKEKKTPKKAEFPDVPKNIPSFKVLDEQVYNSVQLFRLPLKMKTGLTTLNNIMYPMTLKEFGLKYANGALTISKSDIRSFDVAPYLVTCCKSNEQLKSKNVKSILNLKNNLMEINNCPYQIEIVTTRISDSFFDMIQNSLNNIQFNSKTEMINLCYILKTLEDSRRMRKFAQHIIAINGERFSVGGIDRLTKANEDDEYELSTASSLWNHCYAHADKFEGNESKAIDWFNKYLARARKTAYYMTHNEELMPEYTVYIDLSEEWGHNSMNLRNSMTRIVGKHNKIHINLFITNDRRVINIRAQSLNMFEYNGKKSVTHLIKITDDSGIIRDVKGISGNGITKDNCLILTFKIDHFSIEYDSA
jgi:hypothetical protein